MSAAIRIDVELSSLRGTYESVATAQARVKRLRDKLAESVRAVVIQPTFRECRTEYPPNFRRPRGLGCGRRLAEIVAAKRRGASVQFTRRMASKFVTAGAFDVSRAGLDLRPERLA
jgi:hypothetical protein